MSKYLTFNDVAFKDAKTLVAALADCGFSDVEQGTNMHLYGYHGDQRTETADIIVRRKHIGGSSNDLGFARTDAGYVPIISEFDNSSRLGPTFIPKLKTAYSEHVVKSLASRLRGSTKREVEGGKIKLRVRY